MDRKHREEQKCLDNVINDLDEALKNINYKLYENKVKIQKYKECCLADAYGALIQSNKDKKENLSKKNILQNTRKELYQNRLVVESYEDGNKVTSNLLVGLHSYFHKGRNIIYSWYNPVCANYILGNKTTDFQCRVKDKHGVEYITDYKLLLRRKVDLYNDMVQNITDMYNKLQTVDEKIIADEFLNELIKRRDEIEFQNIIFSIQEQQADIIQSPFKDNIVVQGCAGSGKSMIMLHRLPILLFSRQEIKKSDIFIITPSTTYIDLAKNMLDDLEIEDVKMGTINQYYEHIINKYPDKYKIHPNKGSAIQLNSQVYKWIYSDDIILEIRRYIENKMSEVLIDYSDLYKQLCLSQKNIHQITRTYKEKMSNEYLNIQKIVNVNTTSLKEQFYHIKRYTNSMKSLAQTLQDRKHSIIRDIENQIGNEVKAREGALTDLETINEEINPIMYKNRENIIQSSIEKEENLKQILLSVIEDKSFFEQIESYSNKIYKFLEGYPEVKDNFEQNNQTEIFNYISGIDGTIGFAESLLAELEKVEDDYFVFGKGLSNDIKNMRNLRDNIINNRKPYLSMKDTELIYSARKKLDNLNKNLVQDSFIMVQNRTKELDERFDLNVYYDFIPYIYLRIIYTYQGAPNNKLEGLLAVDEAQNLEVSEYKLLNEVNKNVIFNLYGDINQHVENEKGIENWNQINEVVSCIFYEMNNNYRNAKQITEYCNEKFNMNMKAINLPGKGVKEVNSESDIISFIRKLAPENGRSGLSAIIYKDKNILKLIESIKKTNSNFNIISNNNTVIDETKWNIIPVERTKGIEFKRVLVIETTMTTKEKYIAYTRALDELIIYKGQLSGLY